MDSGHAEAQGILIFFVCVDVHDVVCKDSHGDTGRS